MSQWYYRTSEGEVGPLRASELLEQVAAGRIQPHTLVRKGDSQWVEAAQVDGLFDAAATGGTSFQCPFCGHKIERPPTRCAQCQRLVETAYRKHNRKATQEQVESAGSAEAADVELLQKKAQRQDIIAYSVLLVLLVGLACAAPWLYRAAAEEQIPIHRYTMSGIIAALVAILALVALVIGRGRD